MLQRLLDSKNTRSANKITKIKDFLSHVWISLLVWANICKIMVCVTEYIFSPFLPLVLMLWEVSETVTVPVHATRMNLFAPSLLMSSLPFCLKSLTGLRLGADVSVCTQCDLIHVCLVPKKIVHWDYPCHHRSTDLLSVSIQKSKKHYSFCLFLSSAYCILVTYILHKKNKFTSTRW